jgi:hypothetical protein
MPNPRFPFPYLATLFVFACSLTACAPDFFGDGRTRIIPLTDSIRNVSSGHYQAYWEIEDSARWEAVVAKADTIVPEKVPGLPSGDVKLRSETIWYEAKMVKGGLRSRSHYPGWKRNFDSIPRDLNVMLLRNNHRVRVRIPAADVVLGGDSLRIALIHTQGPAFDWDFTEYEPVPDRLLLTTYGNDTLPIVTDMTATGEISRQTVFRVEKQYYSVRTIADDYGSLEIELLEDARGLPLTAELDLSYKSVPVKDLDGKATTIKRTPGRELILYFWGGRYGNKQLRGLDSLYHALPRARRDELDIAVISRFSQAEEMKMMVDSLDFSLPVYLGTEKTCLRLNCSPYLPYFMTVNGRGQIVSFHDWTRVLEDRFAKMME